MIIERTNASPQLKEWGMRLLNNFYMFQRDEQGRMVCDIENPYHCSVLLERNAYREVKPETTPSPVVEPDMSLDSPPVEAKTPPKPRRKPRGRPPGRKTGAAATPPSEG